MYFVSGSGELTLGSVTGDKFVLENPINVGSGESFHIPPMTIHRIKALTDLLIIEASTPQLDDVIRLRDDYGREGTSNP